MAVKMKTGTVEGTGAAINVELGFVPSLVIIMNIDGDALGIYTKDMTAAHVNKLLTGGTLAEMASAGVTLSDPDDDFMGFIIGADTDINVSSETLMWAAFGEA